MFLHTLRMPAIPDAGGRGDGRRAAGGGEATGIGR